MKYAMNLPYIKRKRTQEAESDKENGDTVVSERFVFLPANQELTV